MLVSLNVILITSCISEKDIRQAETCFQTWVKRARNMDKINKRCHIHFICGSIRSPRIPGIISLSDVLDDKSEIDKPWYGLKWCFDSYPTDFYLIGYPNTYFLLDRILTMLENHNFDGITQRLIIGGTGDIKNVEKSLYVLPVDMGIIISHLVLKEIYPLLFGEESFRQKWPVICHQSGADNLSQIWEVSFSYLANQAKIPHLIINRLNSLNLSQWQDLKINRILSLGNLTDKMIQFHQMINAYDLLEKRYEISKNTPSDIWEHIPTLYHYAQSCLSIIKCGRNVSIWALLKGLVDQHFMKENISLIEVDLSDPPYLEEIIAMTTELKVNYTFIRDNSLKVLLPVKNANLVFIDTWHVYGQLKRELAKFAPIATKYIILHDTTVDAVKGETIRNGWNAVEQSKETGIPVGEINRGIWPAVTEFLQVNSNFMLEKRYENNNGLTILKRVR